jgi:hypothetical protein
LGQALSPSATRSAIGQTHRRPDDAPLYFDSIYGILVERPRVVGGFSPSCNARLEDLA